MRELPVVESHAGCVGRVPIFARLDAAQQDDVGSLARPVSLAAGALLHGAGDRMGQLFVVHTGRLKLVRPTAGGQERLIRVAGPGDVVGEHAFLTGERPDHYVEALEDARLCVFDHAELGRLVAAHPPIAVAMLRSLSERLTDAERRVARASVDVPARLAGYLLDLPADTLEGLARVTLPLPKKDIASYLGTTPESLSRAIGRLQDDGLLTIDGRRVTLLNPDGLESTAAN